MSRKPEPTKSAPLCILVAARDIQLLAQLLANPRDLQDARQMVASILEQPRRFPPISVMR